MDRPNIENGYRFGIFEMSLETPRVLKMKGVEMKKEEVTP
jgi:hypothetical protein